MGTIKGHRVMEIWKFERRIQSKKLRLHHAGSLLLDMCPCVCGCARSRWKRNGGPSLNRTGRSLSIRATTATKEPPKESCFDAGNAHN